MNLLIGDESMCSCGVWEFDRILDAAISKLKKDSPPTPKKFCNELLIGADQEVKNAEAHHAFKMFSLVHPKDCNLLPKAENYYRTIIKELRAKASCYSRYRRNPNSGNRICVIII